MRSNHPTLHLFCTLFVLAITAGLASAQLPNADLTRIYPTGAAAGSEVTVTLTGSDLDGVNQLIFSHPGIAAKPVMLPADAVHPKPRIKTNTFALTIAADVKPGIYEVRAAGGRFGISTPRAFAVSPAGTTEVTTPATANTPENAFALEIGQVANGVATANVHHWFRVHAKKGQHLRIACAAERIDSRLDASLTLHDSTGKELDRSRDREGRDPIIDLHPTADTDYLISLNDFLFLGGSQHFYRISLSEGPQIDGVFPPVISTAKPTQVTPIGPGFEGKPAPITLQPHKATADTPQNISPVHATCYSTPITSLELPNSTRPLLAVTDAPIVIEDEKTNNTATGQKLTLPCTVGARFDQPDDADSYRFTAKNGTTYQVEVVGTRLDSTIDPYVVIEKITVDDKGTESYAVVRELDDLSFGPATDATFRMTTHDPATTFVANHDGDYRVTVINQFGSGSPGSEHVYAVHIGEQHADFSLIANAQRPHLEANQVFAAAPLLRRGESFPLRVIISRRGGFAEPVTISASGLPAGVSAPPVTLAPNTDSAVLIVKASSDAAAWSGDIQLIGKAKVGERELSHPVSIAAPVWSITNIGTERLRTRIWNRLPLTVSDAEPPPVALIANEIDGKPYTVTIGEKLVIPVTLEAKGEVKGNIAAQPFGLHGNIRPVAAQIDDKTNSGKVTIDFTPSNNHKPVPGTFEFVIKGTGTLGKYVTDPPALKAATKEVARIAALQESFTAEAAAAKTAATAAKTALDKATAAANAAKPEAKAAADTALAAAKSASDAAQKAATETDAKIKLALAAKTAADAALKAATARSKERDVKFTVYSLPLRVEVKPKPEPAKK